MSAAEGAPTAPRTRKLPGTCKGEGVRGTAGEGMGWGGMARETRAETRLGWRAYLRRGVRRLLLLPHQEIHRNELRLAIASGRGEKCGEG